MPYTTVPAFTAGVVVTAAQMEALRNNGLLDPAAIATTKGQLFVATGANTITALSVGSNGMFPIADSTQASGIRWGMLQITDDLTPAQITSNQNDYNPTNGGSNTVWRISSDAARDITGIVGGYDGRLLLLRNIGNFTITLKNADTGSTSTARFAFNADIQILAGQVVLLWYDSTSARWSGLAGSGGGGTSGHIVQDEAVSVAQRSKLNFEGAGVTVTDDPGNDASVVTIPGVSPLSVATKTANYTATDSDDVLLFDATSGNLTLTLPTAVGRAGKVFTVFKVDSSANTVTVDGNSSETLNGATTVVLREQWDSISLISDNANWEETPPAIPKALGTTKGDLIAFTASGKPVRVGVGTDGDVLTANSGASAGVDWEAPSGAALTVREVDTSPSVSASILEFPNGTLTDHGSGRVEYVPASGASAYTTVQEEGSGLTARTTLNFTGQYVTAADNSGSSRTDVTVQSGMELIADTTLGADAASVTFSSIPGTYKHLVIFYQAASDQTNVVALFIRFNGDTGSNYDNEYHVWVANSQSAGENLAAAQARIGLIMGTGSTGGNGTGQIHIPNYAGTSWHKYATNYGTSRNASSNGDFAVGRWGAGWRSTSAITSITLLVTSGNIKTNSRFTLMGIQ